MGLREEYQKMELKIIIYQMIKKYYKKLFGKNLADVIKEETSGNYQKILLAFIGEN